MMNISDIIMLLLPIILALLLWLLRLAEQRLPEKKRAALDQFARYAVKKIEQQYGSWSAEKKRAYAETIIISLFQDLHLPAPSYALVDAAIEAVVWEINQNKIPKEFFSTDDKPNINTGPIAPVQPEGKP